MSGRFDTLENWVRDRHWPKQTKKWLRFINRQLLDTLSYFKFKFGQVSRCFMQIFHWFCQHESLKLSSTDSQHPQMHNFEPKRNNGLFAFIPPGITLGYKCKYTLTKFGKLKCKKKGEEREHCLWCSSKTLQIWPSPDQSRLNKTFLIDNWYIFQDILIPV